MKKIMLFVATAMMMTSCGFLQGGSSASSSTSSASQVQTTTPTDPMVAGQGAGKALHALYTQYKADGNKFNYKNTQNILNTLNLVINCEELKNNYKQENYLKNFGKGLIASSMGLVTEANVTNVTNSLVDLVKSNDSVQSATSTVQSTANTVAGYANTASQYAGALGTLLSAFSGK